MIARLPILLSALCSFTGLLSAQDDDGDARSRRGISSNLASALAQTMPKFQPPPSEEEQAAAKAAEEERNRPKNGIIRLPTVVVEGERPPVFTEREINTDKGLQEIALKRYFSDANQAFNAFHIPLFFKSKEELAMEMWKEDERLRQIGEIDDQVENLLHFGREDEAKELKELSNDTLGRRDYLPTPSALHRETGP